MSSYKELIEQYRTQIRLLKKRAEELKKELSFKSGGQRDELFLRIALLNQEIDDMYDSINMMKKYIESGDILGSK